MDTEFEATFANIDKDSLRERLKNIGAELVQKERLMRRWTLDFDHPEEKFHRWARVRDEGDKITATYKQHVIDKGDADIDHQKEIEVTVDDFEQMVELLEAVGCRRDMYQENKRESWKLGNCEIEIDTWPHLEPFCEIEAESEKQVRSVAEKLGFDWKEVVFAGTGTIYKDKYGKLPSEAEDVNKLVFDTDNPFTNTNQ